MKKKKSLQNESELLHSLIPLFFYWEKETPGEPKSQQGNRDTYAQGMSRRPGPAPWVWREQLQCQCGDGLCSEGPVEGWQIMRLSESRAHNSSLSAEAPPLPSAADEGFASVF